MIKNAVALVTGGASGLGKATVERFIRNGSRVVICDLKTSDGANLATSLGDNALFVPTDVTSEESVANALAETKTHFGQLNVAVNCAGTARAFVIYNFNKGTKHQLDTFQQCLNVNTTGTFNVIRYAVDLMAANQPNEDGQRGVVINTAGSAAFDGQTGQVAQAASFGGVVSMTVPLARDLSPGGIRVVTIAPGMFDTPMVDFLPKDVKEYLHSLTPVPKRFGKPDEYAHLVEAIVANPLLNGVTIRLDAGLRMIY